MKKSRTTALVLSALLMAPAAFAAQTPAKPAATAKKEATKPAAAAATHATAGVVKSIDDSKLVISKSATKGPETTFVVNSSTQKEGTIAAGTMVDVRYKTEGKEKVATAISVHEAKAKPAAKK
jgi:hypothetical protein